MRCCSDRQFDLLERIVNGIVSIKDLTPGQRKTADWLEEKKMIQVTGSRISGTLILTDYGHQVLTMQKLWYRDNRPREGF